MLTPKQFITKNKNLTKEQQVKAYAIYLLRLHIEHPTKPGYKRHDILDTISLLEKNG